MRDPHIIVYKQSGDQLNVDTQHIGPFDGHDAAYDHLCTLPPCRKGGHKYVERLVTPGQEKLLP